MMHLRGPWRVTPFVPVRLSLFSLPSWKYILFSDWRIYRWLLDQWSPSPNISVRSAPKNRSRTWVALDVSHAEIKPGLASDCQMICRVKHQRLCRQLVSRTVHAVDLFSVVFLRHFSYYRCMCRHHPLWLLVPLLLLGVDLQSTSTNQQSNCLACRWSFGTDNPGFLAAFWQAIVVGNGELTE